MTEIDYQRDIEQYCPRLPAALKEDLVRVFEKRNFEPSTKRRTAANVSFRTAYRRFVNVCAIFRDLHDTGHRLQRLANLQERHIKVLVARWEADRDSVGTIDNRLSYLRTLCKWLGKHEMIGPSRSYASDPDAFNRETAATRDKTWEGNQVDVWAIIDRLVYENEKVIALQLELQLAFGMRVEESFLFRPYIGYLEAMAKTQIGVVHGTKGGRPRTVSLEEVGQMDVLYRASALARADDATMIPQTYTLDGWRNHYYYVLRKHGVTRETLHVTSHGLRHQYLNSLFERITGKPSPIKGGGDYDPDTLSAALQIVVERAGHSDKSKSRAYLGGVKRR